MPQVALGPRGTERWQSGHPWIYRGDLLQEPTLDGGEVVRVVDPRGWFLGKALYSSRSKIALRWMSFEDVAVGPELFAARIAQADALRRALYPGETTYRVVHGEADLLPGLVVDRYGEVLSVQFLVQATEAHRELLTDLLVAHFRPRGVMDRSDVNVRTLEGLEPRRVVLRGDVPERGSAVERAEPAAVPAGRVYFDDRPELIEPSVVRDRRQMAEEGFVVVFISSTSRDADIAVVTRGVAGSESEIGEEVRRAARAVLARATAEEREDPEWLRAEIAIAAKRACRRVFDIRPVIVPVVA